MKKLLNKSGFWLILSIICGFCIIFGGKTLIVAVPCALICAIQATYCFAIESINKKHKNDNNRIS